MDFDSMKYAELQSVAKELGLKANMKAEKLLKLIKQHFEQNEEKLDQEMGITEVQENKPVTQDNAQESKESPNSEASSPTVFVNTRRGRGKSTKRKISDSAIMEAEAEISPSAAEDDPKEAESREPCDTRGAKKRKVSSTKDLDQTETKPLKELTTTGSEQQQPESKEEARVVNAEKAPKVAKGGRIPRYQGSQQKDKPLLKPITPNFKKLHEAHFNKMESIDSYVQRKTKQVESYKNSVKELKKLVDKTKMQQVEKKTQVRANVSRTSMFSPVPVSKKAAEERRRHTLLSASKAPANKPAAKDVAPFRPDVLSTRRINVRFSEAVHDNEYKKSMVKTPARKSPCVTASTPKTQAAPGGKPNARTSIVSASKTSAPFIFTGNTSMSTTPGTQKKASFNLKASLSRPLTYKPHTGKLKPFGEPNENAANKSLILNSHQKNYKQHQVQTRGDRRTKHMEERKQKKEGMLGARRGLVMM